MSANVTARTPAVHVEDRWWSGRIRLVADEVIPYQWNLLNDNVPDAVPSHAVWNLKIAAGEMEGEFQGEVFQDSDFAKWLEAASHVLAQGPNPGLEALVDESIALIAKAQGEDGYLNTYYQIKAPEERFTNLRDNHELYCAGHFIEAAVAHYRATGKRTLLDPMCKYADYIASVFGPGPGQIRGYDGHEEIELALVKLYRATGNKKYLDLASFFIEERGREPYFFALEAEKRGETAPVVPQHAKRTHLQAHLPVREQTTAEGHAVRVAYLCSAMADLARENGDATLAAACRRIWDNVVGRRMYITGGIGSMWWEEAFTFDYDLPNGRAYSETCAAIGMVLWAHRMLNLEADGEYADVMERSLYNGVLSGMSLDGQRYFYVNPLELWPEEAKRRVDHQHVKPERVKWYGCACCPPNIARLIASLHDYIYTLQDDLIYVHLYIGSTVEFAVGGRSLKLTQRSGYPYDGNISFKVEAESDVACTLAFRIPGWCRGAELLVNGLSWPVDDSTVNKGYVKLSRDWKDGDTVELVLPMPVERMLANPKVRENAGKVAIQRGPVVYCFEEVDNGGNLRALSVPVQAEFSVKHDPELMGGITTLTVLGERDAEESFGDGLYRTFGPAAAKVEPAMLTAVPYACWGNRGLGEMAVWMRRSL